MAQSFDDGSLGRFVFFNDTVNEQRERKREGENGVIGDKMLPPVCVPSYVTFRDLPIIVAAVRLHIVCLRLLCKFPSLKQQQTPLMLLTAAI